MVIKRKYNIPKIDTKRNLVQETSSIPGRYRNERNRQVVPSASQQDWIDKRTRRYDK